MNDGYDIMKIKNDGYDAERFIQAEVKRDRRRARNHMLVLKGGFK